MAAISAYFSRRRGETVHHNQDDCQDGNNIEDYYFAWGTGGLPLCHRCQRISAARVAAILGRYRR